jgi:hypothetical protein
MLSQGKVIVPWLLDVGHRSIELLLVLLNLLLVYSLVLLKLGNWDGNLTLHRRCLGQRALNNRCHLLALLLLFSLEFFYALNNFNPVKAQLDVKIPFQVCISHVVYDLAINTNFL